MQKQANLFFILIFFLLLISYFLNLDIYALYLEEPRRALIALEMIFSGNYIVPTEMGEFYYKKPPIFNWLIIGMYKLMGNYSELAGRIITILSLLLLGIIHYLFAKKYVAKEVAFYSALFFLISVDIYFHFSLLGEIDIFYSLLTYLSLIAIFHFFQTSQFVWLFVVSFFFAALGFLTKGLPSILFLYITLFFFFISEKAFKRFFTGAHFLGIVVFTAIVGGYFLMYIQYNSFLNYLNGLWFQSKTMTVLEESRQGSILHLITFPLDNLKSLAPAIALLVLFVFRKGTFKMLMAHNFIRYSLIVFFTNIVVYWVSPGARPKYVYMLYPFMITVIVYAYFEIKEHNPLRLKIFYFIVGFLIIAFLGACMALPFIEVMSELNAIWVIALGGLLYALALFVWFVKDKRYVLRQLIALTIGIRIVFDFTVLPVRAGQLTTLTDKKDAYKIAQLTKGQPLYISPDTIFSLATVFYLERERQATLSYKAEKNCSDFFLIFKDYVSPENADILYEFEYQGAICVLVKFKNC